MGDNPPGKWRNWTTLIDFYKTKVDFFEDTGFGNSAIHNCEIYHFDFTLKIDILKKNLKNGQDH